jgi:hypothetical protein
VKYQLLLSKDLEYLPGKKYTEMAEAYERVSMMLTKLHRAIK